MLTEKPQSRDSERFCCLRRVPCGDFGRENVDTPLAPV